jgi:hypothetical protein
VVAQRCGWAEAEDWAAAAAAEEAAAAAAACAEPSWCRSHRSPDCATNGLVATSCKCLCAPPPPVPPPDSWEDGVSGWHAAALLDPEECWELGAEPRAAVLVARRAELRDQESAVAAFEAEIDSLIM